METLDLKKELYSIKDNLDKRITDEIKPLQEAFVKNQEGVNTLLSEYKNYGSPQPRRGKTFQEAFAQAVEKNYDDINAVQKRRNHIIQLDAGLSLSDSPNQIHGKRSIVDYDTKAVGTMTTGASLTGDSVVTYSPVQVYLPKQKVNFRDLIRTVNSPTGVFVHHKESGGEGSISQQTEGSSKSQIDFDFTEVKTVGKYVSGYLRISKQALKSLPFLQADLPVLLMREFFKKENSVFKQAVAVAANNASPTSETDDVKQIIDYIAYQRDLDYEVDYALVSHTQRAQLDKLTYTTGYYQSSGGVISNENGTIMISGVPIIAASWMTNEKVLLVDSTYLSRVEVEGLKIEFFEQDADNVTKNLITVRIECYEEINPMLGSAFLYSNL